MTLVIKFLGGGGSGELSNPTGTLKKKKQKKPHHNKIWQTGLFFLNQKYKLHFNYVYYYTKRKMPNKF